MRTSKHGFLLVTVLLVLFVVLSLGVVLLGKASSDSRFVQHEISNIQAEEIARSSLAYYKVHGVPPLVNGKPQKLFLFPEKNQIVEISQEGDTLRLTGTIWDGDQIRSQISYRVPLWDLNDFEKVQ